MNEPVKCKGIYKDSFGTREIIIENDFKTLSMEIDGVTFSGSEFNDLAIADKTKYAASQLERFTFLKTPVYQSDLIWESLCNCSIEIVVPQVIIDKVNAVELYADLYSEFSMGNINAAHGDRLEAEEVRLTVTIEGNQYSATGDVMEVAFDRLHTQFDNKYHFKNCYGCMFGDYSVFGQSTFGSMLCFASQKEKYMTVKDKADYMDLGTADRCVQEIYCCDKFEIRRKGVGYRC